MRYVTTQTTDPSGVKFVAKLTNFSDTGETLVKKIDAQRSHYDKDANRKI